MSTEQRHWYVMYTRPFWEKKVQMLIEKLFSIEAYCPVRRVPRRWSDRIKIIEEPYFRSYVFVRATNKERTVALNADGVVSGISFQGRPAFISDQEMESLKGFLRRYENIEVKQLEPGERVMICQGVFTSTEGVVHRVDGEKVVIVLTQLNCMLTAPRADVQKVIS